MDDTLLYPAGQRFVDRNDIVGVVVAYVPCLGWATILADENPWTKVLLIVALPLISILQKQMSKLRLI